MSVSKTVQNSDDGKSLSCKTTYTTTLKARNSNINDFIKMCKVYRTDKLLQNNKDKLFHFVYQGEKSKDDVNTMVFTSTVLKNLSCDTRNSHETFDHIITPHSAQIMRDIDRLHDLEYYKRTGMRRKKGYLFHDPPGTGKTATVMAMANYDKRHILEIPVSRVKTNKEIEDILNLKSINEISFEKDEIIILFDELDRIGKNNDCEPAENTDTKDTGLLEIIQKNYSNRKNSFDFVSALSRLDGIGNYNGIIIVGTTNNKDHIDPAVYRDLRLSALLFDYCVHSEAVTMIEKFYDVRLNDAQLRLITDLDVSHKLASATLKYLLEKYENNLDDLLEYLHSKYLTSQNTTGFLILDTEI